MVFWYAHGSVSWKLQLAEKLASTIVTSSKKGFRLPSKKLVVVGQGIDIEKFKPIENHLLEDKLKLVTVGRISPTKDYESMIKAVDILNNQGIDDIQLKIIGAPGLKEQQVYLENLQQMVIAMRLEGKVVFLGSITNSKIPAYLQQSDIFLNFSSTGSLDKAILEAMACGCVCLTSNEAFSEVLPAQLVVKRDQPRQLAEKIRWLKNLNDLELDKLKQNLRQIVVKNHNLDNLVKKICAEFTN